MSKWFRWYEGTCEDGKFRCVARNGGVTVATVMGVWAALLEDASNDDHRGVAVRGEDFYAAILDLPPEDLQRILQEMDEMKIISVGHCNITITKWKERQFETDTTDGTNAERQRRWREKRKPNEKITPRNARVTAAKRPDTDTDTDTDKTSSLRSEGARKRGARLQAEWKPSAEDANEAMKRLGGPIPAEQELLKFHDYWKAQPGQRGVKLDWDATWRNWIRNAKGQPNGRRTVHDAARDLHETIVARVLAFDEPAPSGIREREGEDVVRLLPSR